MALPDKFPPGTVFADVEGKPVSLSPGENPVCWDTPEGRPFPFLAFLRNGKLISEVELRAPVVQPPNDSPATSRRPGDPADWGQKLVDNLNRNVLNNVPTP